MERVIEISGLGIQFGGHSALQGVSFGVSPGDSVAILGPNGSGKSTLIKAILGLIPPTEGDIRVFGRRPQDVPPGQIGYVPQIKTFDRTFPAVSVDLVISGLRMGWPGRVRAEDARRAEEALGWAGAGHLAMRRIGTLSGGELQRVYLARSLVRNPRLVLLDEPATGIDVAGESDLYQVLDTFRKQNGLTIVMVTHDWEAAFHHADAILLINSVQIAFGPPAVALTEQKMREAFGHVGHAHSIYRGD